MIVVHHLGKVNMVADSLKLLSIKSFAHIEDYKKQLLGDVYMLARLGILLIDSSDGGVVVHNRSQSSFVSNLKAK